MYQKKRELQSSIHEKQKLKTQYSSTLASLLENKNRIKSVIETMNQEKLQIISENHNLQEESFRQNPASIDQLATENVRLKEERDQLVELYSNKSESVFKYLCGGIEQYSILY